MQALFLLAFVLALREADRTWGDLPLRYVPAALVAVGSIYTYSFPSLIWLGAAAVIWTLLTQPAARALGLAVVVFVVLTLPELPRMLDFHSFETFDPNGPGLGNLFGQISPFEALGIWPSGDFRLAPGDGAVPAVAYYLGIAFALALVLYGLVHLWRRRERAILAGVAAAVLAYVAARLGGTPYTAAKAIEIAAPLVALTILLPRALELHQLHHPGDRKVDAVWRGGPGLPVVPVAMGLFVVAAGVCSLLALANAPVGPTSYSSKLSDYRKVVGEGPTLVVASPRLLSEEHGGPFLSWELRGGRVCIRSTEEAGKLPPGVRFVVHEGADWTLTRVRHPVPGKSPCPLIAERQARQGPAR
jgi:hypothetical protein